MEAFVGPRPPRLVVCHSDGDHHNNRLCNLRYDTNGNNQRDRTAHGTGQVGRPRQDGQLLRNAFIRWKIRQGFTHKQLALIFGVGSVSRSESHSAEFHSHNRAPHQFGPVLRENLFGHGSLPGRRDACEPKNATVRQSPHDRQLPEVLVQRDQNSLFPVSLRKYLLIAWVFRPITAPHRVVARPTRSCQEVPSRGWLNSQRFNPLVPDETLCIHQASLNVVGLKPGITLQ
jgi:hypothetical protein